MNTPNEYPGPDLQAPPQRDPDDVTRALPHAIGPEKSLLSSMLQEPQEFIGIAVEEKLTADHFYQPSHSALFGFLVELFNAGQEIELVSLVQRLLDRGLLNRVGGPAVLTDLYTYAPSPGHFRYHMKHVKDKFVLRSIIQNSNEAIAEAYDSPEQVEELLDTVEAKIMAIREGAVIQRTPTTKEAVNRVIENFQRRCAGERDSRGITTGFEELDRMCNGMKPGDMFVVGARPSMGKTSFMMNVVEHVCITEGKPCLVFSAEMSRDQVIDRLVFSRAKFSLSQHFPGQTPVKGDLQRIQRSALETAAAKLFVDDSPGPSVNFIRAVARRYKREHKIEFIALDYLQLCKSLSKQAASSREREISEISAGIKGLAKELGIPIMILAQLGRKAEERGGSRGTGKPRMSDLRESGSIEQDADMVGLLYRDAYYAESNEEKEANAGRAQLDLAKNRNGQTGVIPLTFIAELMRFESGPPAQEEQVEMFAPKPPRSRFDD
ncbi:replicative DNA helicase [Luteolibacter yonseiensis]|uniref:Replicative DNA helicase n=1 Tax=Luteolibacter yonseiensis TaxID=1144680 RepID=A0A934V8Q5_9BACT|nr:replicative DNA helicase [Luteolibacter yonseiensis]MBK1817507.1 replicative DNA helicase [Luteolibacter yonseiensis]